MQGQKNFTVEKAGLLATLRVNRNKHAEKYTIAVEEFRKEAIEEMRANLQQAEDGGKVVRHLKTERPQSHVEEYDNVIGMLDLCVADSIDITFSDFKQYVKDEWVWKRDWEISNAKYLAARG